MNVRQKQKGKTIGDKTSAYSVGDHIMISISSKMMKDFKKGRVQTFDLMKNGQGVIRLMHVDTFEKAKNRLFAEAEEAERQSLANKMKGGGKVGG